MIKASYIKANRAMNSKIWKNNNIKRLKCRAKRDRCVEQFTSLLHHNDYYLHTIHHTSALEPLPEILPEQIKQMVSFALHVFPPILLYIYTLFQRFYSFVRVYGFPWVSRLYHCFFFFGCSCSCSYI